MSDDDIDLQARERVDTMVGDKWKLERLLGIGGMAAVYEGRHRNGARAAIKVLHPMLSRHPEVRERFLREGYAANKVEHPGVVKVLDDDVIADGPDTGTAYIVMELLEGESLQDRLERGPPLTEVEFLRIAEGVLDVLDAAHTKGVVHRDLKPENLFLAKSEDPLGPLRVKVLDFGLARLLDGATITSYGLALGTPSFMSPEQAAGRIDEIDGRTDLFAIGATGFRVRTGRRIQEGANAVELVTKMANFSAPPIRGLVPEVSEPYARVVDRALQFKREDRYPDAASMRDDVRKAITELDGHARTVPAFEAVPVSRPVSRPPPPPPLPRRASVPPPRPPAPSGEATVELSGGDIEPSGQPSLETSLPVVTPPPRRRRRSVLPWLTLLVFVAIGGKLWMDAHPTLAPTAPVAATPSLTATAPASTLAAAPAPSPTQAPTQPPSAPPTPATAPTPEPEPEPELASADAPEPAAPVPSAPTPAPATAVAMNPPQAPMAHAPPPAAPMAAHPRPAPKVGPGNVHVLHTKHHKKGH